MQSFWSDERNWERDIWGVPFTGDEANGLFGVKHGDSVFSRKTECIDWFVGDKLALLVWFSPLLSSAVLLARTVIAGGFLTLVIFIIKGKPRNSPQDLIMAQLLEFIWIHGMGSFLSLKTMSHWVWQLMDLMGNHFILWCLQLQQEQKWGCNVVHRHPFLCSIFVVQRLANIYQILKLLRLYPYHLGWNDIFVMNLIGSSRSTFPHKWRKPVTLICDICVLETF